MRSLKEFFFVEGFDVVKNTSSKNFFLTVKTFLLQKTHICQACFQVEIEFCSVDEMVLVIGEDARDLVRKENLELKRVISAEQSEKEAINSANEQLRNNIKKLENEKTNLFRNVEERNQRIAS